MGVFLIPFVLAMVTGVGTIIGVQPALQEEQNYLQQCDLEHQACSLPQWPAMSFLPSIAVFFGSFAVMQRHQAKKQNAKTV